MIISKHWKAVFPSSRSMRKRTISALFLTTIVISFISKCVIRWRNNAKKRPCICIETTFYYCNPKTRQEKKGRTTEIALGKHKKNCRKAKVLITRSLSNAAKSCSAACQWPSKKKMKQKYEGRRRFVSMKRISEKRCNLISEIRWCSSKLAIWNQYRKLVVSRKNEPNRYKNWLDWRAWCWRSKLAARWPANKARENYGNFWPCRNQRKPWAPLTPQSYQLSLPRGIRKHNKLNRTSSSCETTSSLITSIDCSKLVASSYSFQLLQRVLLLYLHYSLELARKALSDNSLDWWSFSFSLSTCLLLGQVRILQDVLYQRKSTN